MSAFPQKILVATDGSADAERATEAAADLTKRAQAELHVVHVWHDVPGFAHDFVKRELKRQGQEILDEQVEKIRGTGAVVAEAGHRTRSLPSPRRSGPGSWSSAAGVLAPCSAS